MTGAIATRRQIDVRLLPVTDEPVRTMLTLAADTISGRPAPRWRFRTTSSASVTTCPCGAVRFAGAETPGRLPRSSTRWREAEQIVVCPSNPIVSIGPLLAVPGILAALTARRDDVIAVSPIVAGAALKGPADRLMAELGTEPSVVGVARLYAPG